ncbi:4-hydroxy-tetrahydrodipicolinate synthase [Luteimonas deserti]|uniref:4-hydroxy-tetrahydrodipicolinate synthase n=1 Tax=Luteimonas deserti TaxID=2752306 RepID=A0A7Z0TWW1_9GAMM|nr:4-hydroxy-tetrahydrodipicolinate synthase [Luteimonas deserti]NYZ63799.1 4-hydroxy-tetrahydrodipicolinate synthase [Luteimonas deserti]
MRLSGSITALATPFTASGDLDRPAWKRLLESQLEAGTQGFVVAGSTGEAAMLEAAEYDWLVSSAVELVAARVPVLAGTGHSATTATIAATRRAAALGADMALVVVPPYVRPTQAGLLAHYRAVANASDVPVILYNVPGRSGTDMAPETVAALATHPCIGGIKEAHSAPERMQALLTLRNEGFAVLSGDDPTAARAMLAGADGTISVVSNIVPAAFRRLCDLARAGRTDEAWAWNGRLESIHHFSGIEPNPIPVKAVLARQGFGHGLRLPLTTLATAHTAAADDAARLAADLEASCRARAA